MKIQATVLTLASLLMLSAVGGVSLAQSAGDATGMPVQQQAVTAQDQTFIKQASQINLTEVMNSELALQKSANPQIRALATKMVQDHTQANTDLARIALSLGITPPTTPDLKQKAAYVQLSALSGDMFDQAYIQQMTRGHQEAVTLFSAQSTQGNNPALKAYAQTYLPALETHLASLQQQSVAMQQPSTQSTTTQSTSTEKTTESEMKQTSAEDDQSQSKMEAKQKTQHQAKQNESSSPKKSQPERRSTVRGYW